MLSLLGNILWFLLGGVWLGLSWLVSGVLCCLTIVGIPFGIACFRIAGFAFFPFGKKLIPSANAGTVTFALNVIWFVFIGLWLAIEAVSAGIACCLTIIGIPWGVACFKIALAGLAPLGKDVVRV